MQTAASWSFLPPAREQASRRLLSVRHSARLTRRALDSNTTPAHRLVAVCGAGRFMVTVCIHASLDEAAQSCVLLHVLS